MFELFWYLLVWAFWLGVPFAIGYSIGYARASKHHRRTVEMMGTIYGQ